MRLLLRWFIMAASVGVAAAVCHVFSLGFTADTGSVGGVIRLLGGVLLLGLLNVTFGTIIRFLTWPLSCITLGLFSLVVNALVLWMAAYFNFGFHITNSGVRGFEAAFVASIIISFVNGVLGSFLPDKDPE